MAINRKTHVNASSILTIETYEKIKRLAQKNKRSISSQIAYMLEQALKKEEEAKKEGSE